MKAHRIIACLLLGTSAIGVAAPSSKLAWTPANLSRVSHGDAANGKRLAESCSGCHSLGPAPEGSTFPLLQGQLATYLYKQLQDYRDGSRSNPIMTGIAQGLSDSDMANLAAFYSQQSLPAAAQLVVHNDVGEHLAEQGDSKRILPPCQACHEADGRGQRIDIPALAGQNAAYLEQTLLDYRSGSRHNDLYGRMRTISQHLSDSEIKDLARYYGGLSR